MLQLLLSHEAKTLLFDVVQLKRYVLGKLPPTVTFIVLLFGLFCVAGNITIDGEFAGSPRINTALFVFGTLLSSVIGTTGSSMLLVRPFIKMNSWRKRKSHL